MYKTISKICFHFPCTIKLISFWTVSCYCWKYPVKIQMGYHTFFWNGDKKKTFSAWCFEIVVRIWERIAVSGLSMRRLAQITNWKKVFRNPLQLRKTIEIHQHEVDKLNQHGMRLFDQAGIKIISGMQHIILE